MAEASEEGDSSGTPPALAERARPTRRYLVKWQGLTYDQCTWEEEADVPREAIEAYHQREAQFLERCALTKPHFGHAHGESSGAAIDVGRNAWHLPQLFLCRALNVPHLSHFHVLLPVLSPAVVPCRCACR